MQFFMLGRNWETCGLVVLEKDLREVPASNIARIRVLMTIAAGKIAHSTFESKAHNHKRLF